MNNFIYEIPTRVYFGQNQIEGNLSKELSKFGKNILIVYGGNSIKKSGLYDRVLKELNNSNFNIFELSGIEPNPRIDAIRRGAEICKQNNIDVVLAIGGGSVIDSSKFICAGAFADFDPWDFFVKQAPIEKALPLITILTISATGSEMNAGGVISNLETNDKIGRKSPLLRPKVSFLDPTITYSVSKYQTASGSSDIISHVLETYLSLNKDMYMLDLVMEGLIKTVVKYAPIALEKPNDYEARANLMWAASWALNDFIRSDKTHIWSCHAMEHQLSAFYDITHGHGLAILTPRWLKYCLNDKTAPKIKTLGESVFNISSTLNDIDGANATIDAFSDFFFNKLGLPSTLSELGIDDKNFKLMAQKACKNSVINGFIPLNADDIEKIFRMCL